MKIEKFYHTGIVFKNLMERYFALKISFLNFSETKKFSTESVLTFRELPPLVSYKWISYEKNTCICTDSSDEQNTVDGL